MEEVLEKAQKGDKRAYEQIIKLIEKDLYNIANVKLGNTEDAKDAVQETLIKFYKHIDKIQKPQYVKTWVVRILINECNNIYKARKRKSNLIEKLQTNVEVKENELDKLENKVVSEDLLKTLNDKEKIIVALHYKYDYTIQAICELLGMKEGTVKCILHRVREKLNKQENKTKHFTKLLAFLFAIILITSGITFAGRVINTLKEKIIMFQMSSSNAVNSAILNDYPQKVNTDFIYNNDIGIKVDKVAIDDKLLYISYVLDFNSDIEIKDLELETYNISDNNYNVLSLGIATDINNIYGSDYSSGGVTCSTKPLKNEDGTWYYETTYQVIYNKNYPLSKKINISIEKFSAMINGQRKYFEGKWNFVVDLEEKFQNRICEYYKSSPNEKLKSVTAKLNDLSFEIVLEFNEDINRTIINSNSIILQNENGETIECFLKIINDYSNTVTYICDLGKYSKDIDKLNLYMKYNYGKSKVIDIILEK
ncbi:MAG: sigma-70 family RNA polymerase sigma factor [Clostridia bacterium]|nr:sigma-70 family RNA polymerase sigma factor [Clostridia bacterium]